LIHRFILGGGLGGLANHRWSNVLHGHTATKQTRNENNEVRSDVLQGTVSEKQESKVKARGARKTKQESGETKVVSTCCRV
jgi:hypothetical protein